jgi:predicted unusual protein kinase regulating ubiquinone biosynthesis (AarF/ABC1/UbiB family)
MNCIHADPNPGNFIIDKDLHIGLLDFGCVKHLDPDFVNLYGRIPRTALTGSKTDHMELLKAFQIGGPNPDPEALKQMVDLTYETGHWFSKLYQEEYFDFGANADFVQEGKQMMHKVFEHRKHIQKMDMNFLYLHRTRYGLVRLFEMMKARVKIQNPYELEGNSNET